MRKVTVKVVFDLLIHVDDDQTFEDVINELEYSFNADETSSTVIDAELVDYTVIDSR